MRYYLILLTLWAFFALNAFSQSPEDRGLTISGTIQDAELKEPTEDFIDRLPAHTTRGDTTT